MKIVPQNKQEWLSFVLLPFKAYTIIAPVLFTISSGFPRPRQAGATGTEALLVAGLFPCAAFLLFAALLLALVGPKGSAPTCLGFGLAALGVGYLLLPSLAHT